MKLDDRKTKNPYANIPREFYQREGKKLSFKQILQEIKKLNLTLRGKKKWE